MREIIDYSNNFKLREMIERKRNKDDVAYRGIATIQVFDEKGELIQEVKSENCISDRWVSLLYRTLYNNNLINNVGSNLLVNSPAKYLILTDNAEEENPHDLFVHGSLIGFANGWNTYSGEDKFRGTMNSAETSKDAWSKHFVIDFPTHAANGTFQSLYWVTSYDYPIKYLFKEIKKMNGNSKINSYSSNSKLIKNGEFIYSSYHSTLSKYNLNCEKKESVVLKNTVKSMCSVENEIWIFYGDVKEVDIYDTDLKFIRTITPNVPSEPYAYSLSGNVIDVGGKFLHAGGLNNTFLLDKTLTFMRKIEGIEYTIPFYVGNGEVIFTDSYTHHKMKQQYLNVESNNEYLWHKNGTYVFIQNDINPGDYSSSGGHYLIFNGTYSLEDNLVYYLDYTGNLFTACIVPWFAHTLLPAPVTKTATNTMKIQYDFIVEERGFFD